jgi:hypothetical protein
MKTMLTTISGTALALLTSFALAQQITPNANSELPNSQKTRTPNLALRKLRSRKMKCATNLSKLDLVK